MKKITRHPNYQTECPKHPMQMRAWLNEHQDKECGICVEIKEQQAIAGELDTKLAEQNEYVELLILKRENIRKKEELTRMKLLISGKITMTSSLGIKD